MSKYEDLLQKFRARQKTTCTTMTMLNSPLLLEQMNREDLDFVIFDAEHGIFDTQNVVPLLQICRLMGLPSFVRAQDIEYHLIAKAIDMGADGVVTPRTETPEQLKAAVDALLFYPQGRKGCGGHGQFRPGEAFDDFSKTRFLIPQIESPRGIDMLPKMLEDYGRYISAILIGPYDLSVMLGTPRQIDSPDMLDAIGKVFRICSSYEKSCGIFCDNALLAQKYRAMGSNVLWLATDKDFLLRGYRQEMDALARIP